MRLYDLNMIRAIILKINSKLKQILDKIIPTIIVYKLLPYTSKFLILLNQSQINKAKVIFNNAKSTPVWLKTDIMVEMLQKYPPQFIAKFDTIRLKHLGRIKANELIKLIKHNNRKFNKVLELGCNDGLVCYFLQKMKKEVFGIDIQSQGFDKRILKSGVNLIKMDASNLQFKNESIDFIYSYNAFEHFLDPEKVLQESIRVLKKNGYLFFTFEPLYTSPWGLHLWQTFPIPYGQYFFPESTIKDYLKKSNDLNQLTIDSLNKWSIEDFRKLWRKYSDKLKIIKNYEYLNINYLDLIMKYPSCFKSKTISFDDLIVKKVSILLEKIK
ncbi:MAG: class I SAM-dependent methyltransferase [Promethearchaeota archaeon]